MVQAGVPPRVTPTQHKSILIHRGESHSQQGSCVPTSTPFLVLGFAWFIKRAC